MIWVDELFEDILQLDRPVQDSNARFSKLLPKFDIDKITNIGQFQQVLVGILSYLVDERYFKVYFQAVPPQGLENVPANRRRIIEHHLKTPQSREAFLKAVKLSTSLGYPPPRIYAHLVGLDIKELQDLVGDILKERGYDPAKLGKLLQSIKNSRPPLKLKPRVVATKTTQIKTEQLQTVGSGKKVQFHLSHDTSASKDTLPLSVSHMGDFLGILKARDYENIPPEKMAEAVVHAYYSSVLKRLEQVNVGFQKAVNRTINSSRVLSTYAYYRNMPPEQVHGGDEAPKGELSRNPGTLKNKDVGDVVSASHYTNDPFDRSLVVSANPGDHFFQKSDGSYIKGFKYAAKAGEIPLYKGSAEKVLHSGAVPNQQGFPPVLENDRYAMQMGLKHPSTLLPKDVRTQVYWFSNANLLQSSVKNGVKLTGTTPLLFILVRDKVHNKLVNVGHIMKQPDLDARDLKSKFKALQKRISTSAQRGKQERDRFLEQLPDSISEKGRERIREAWDKSSRSQYVEEPKLSSEDLAAYRNFVNRSSAKDLHVFFPALPGEIYKRVAEHPKEAKKKAIRRIRKRIFGDEPKKSEWGIYFVEYLVAYGQSSNPRSPAFMIPANALEKDLPEDFTPPTQLGSLSRFGRSSLMKYARSEFPEVLNIVQNVKRSSENTEAWEFIPGGARKPFPYPRMVRDGFISDEKYLSALNKRLSGPGVKRTQMGYEINGREYEAHMMITLMPKELARKRRSEGGYGLIDPNRRQRDIRTTAQHVASAIRSAGLSPTRTSLVVPDKRNKAITSEILIRGSKIRSKQAQGRFEHRPRAGTITISVISPSRLTTGGVSGQKLGGKVVDPGVYASVNVPINGKINHKYMRGEVDHKTGKWELKFLANVPTFAYVVASYDVGSGISRTDISLSKKDKYVRPDDPDLGIPQMTVLPPGYFDVVARRTSTTVERHLNKVGDTVERAIYDIRKEDDERKREHLTNRLVQYRDTSLALTERVLRAAVGPMFKAAYPSLRSLHDKTNQVISYADEQKTIPRFGEAFPIRTYTAHVGSVRGRSALLSVKAPSEDVAKLLILYRLLRRSARNKAIGRLANVPSFKGKGSLIADVNLLLLKYWKNSDFAVDEQQDPRNIRTVAPRRRTYYGAGRSSSRQSNYAKEHSRLRMVRFNK